MEIEKCSQTKEIILGSGHWRGMNNSRDRDASRSVTVLWRLPEKEDTQAKKMSMQNYANCVQWFGR